MGCGQGRNGTAGNPRHSGRFSPSSDADDGICLCADAGLSLKISDEITQAAITRGIDHVEKRTCIETVRFHTADALVLVIYAGIIALAFYAAREGWF